MYDKEWLQNRVVSRLTLRDVFFQKLFQHMYITIFVHINICICIHAYMHILKHTYIYIYTHIYIYMYIPGPLTTVCFLRALRNLKHLDKTVCQNHDFESFRNATRTNKKNNVSIQKNNANLVSCQDRSDLFSVC